jgi:hypothetical protein
MCVLSRLLNYPLKSGLYSQLVHFLYQHAGVVAEHLAQCLDDMLGIALTSQSAIAMEQTASTVI